ncbi:oligosaccharide flippase family protein [Paenibacillus brasilensis]|uniref:Stage V sporulation protein B n=1 Tax=Paenibacillus brasilensis TaxID=128574 RepID=A0ABU0KTR9_9BACL|nr:oligosaccharide flippase family protein [Paenibacillus brasilensis]MDQ0492832.1 stage V sporulation protein B [Paenibacillus brasilensis]
MKNNLKLPLILKQTMVRANAMIVVKAIGLVGKVFMTRLVGAEGIGLYQLAYSFYGLILMIISGGLPTALGMFTAKHTARGWRLFKVFAIFLIITGLACSVLTFWLSKPIAYLLGYPKLDVVIRCFSPAILAVPLLSLLRGYLQGLERYTAIALSEIIEQTARIGTLMWLVPIFIQSGIELAVGGAVLGTFTGALLAFALLTAIFMYNRPSVAISPPSTRTDLPLVVHASFAIALTRLLNPVSDFMDAIIIPQRLQVAGVSSKEAAEMFGIVTGIALVVAYMPTLITGSLTHTLTMKITADWQNKDYSLFYKKNQAALQIAWVWGLASGFFIFEYASEISLFVFGIQNAEIPIKSLAMLPLLVGLREITTSILWAQNRKKTPFIGLGTGVLVNFMILYSLVAIPGLGYAGMSLGIIMLELIATAWNFKALELFQRTNSRTAVMLLVDILVFEVILIMVTLCSKLLSSLGWPQTGLIIIEILHYCFWCALYLKVRLKRVFEE